MDQPEAVEQLANQDVDATDVKVPTPTRNSGAGTVFLQQATPGTCSNCGSVVTPNLNGGEDRAPSYIYALGNIDWRFPSLGVEKEVVQAIGQTDTAGQTDAQAFQSALYAPDNRYLVRQLCWVLTIEGLDTYILVPRSDTDLEMLIKATRANPSRLDVDVVVGVRGPIAPPEMCNGLMIPMVAFDHIWSFPRKDLIESIPKPSAKGVGANQFQLQADDVLERIMQLADNAGATDEHRALNYLAVRYLAIYHKTSEAYGQNSSFTGVEIRPSRLSGVRKVMDVIFSYTSRATDVTEKFFVRVDVTERFPFLVTKLSPFYDR